MSGSENALSLVADVGGTNTRVALASGPALLTESVKKYPNSDFPSLEAVLATYVDSENVECRAAAVAIAGPVRDGRGTLTNLDWSMDVETLARVTKAEEASILNDLQAQGHAMEHVAAENLHAIVRGTSGVQGTRLVIGVGTGFNAAVVYDTPLGRLVPPSEAGHVNAQLPLNCDIGLTRFIEASHGFASIEDLLSGRGLENIYAWTGAAAGTPTRKTAAQIMADVADDSLARGAVRIFVQVLGTVTGNLALLHLPFGGIWLIGGVARAMIPYFDTDGFADAFRDKGRFSSFMETFSIDVVEDDFAALAGLAAHADELFDTKRKLVAIE